MLATLVYGLLGKTSCPNAVVWLRGVALILCNICDFRHNMLGSLSTTMMCVLFAKMDDVCAVIKTTFERCRAKADI